jgi:hypothetical protein
MRKENRKLRPSIKKDVIHPSDYLKYKFMTACEDCTHFNLAEKTCTFGYQAHHHLRETQTKSYFLSGKMAICRFMEID